MSKCFDNKKHGLFGRQLGFFFVIPNYFEKYCEIFTFYQSANKKKKKTKEIQHYITNRYIYITTQNINMEYQNII